MIAPRLFDLYNNMAAFRVVVTVVVDLFMIRKKAKIKKKKNSILKKQLSLVPSIDSGRPCLSRRASEAKLRPPKNVQVIGHLILV